MASNCIKQLALFGMNSSPQIAIHKLIESSNVQSLKTTAITKNRLTTLHYPFDFIPLLCTRRLHSTNKTHTHN